MRRILLFSLAITACLLLLVVVRPAWPSHNPDVLPPRPAPGIVDSPARQAAPLPVATSSAAIPDPGLPAPDLAPTVITAGVETPVTITVAMSDPKLSSLKIQYTRPDGDWTTLDASPHDDGKKGDLRAGDRVFTLVVKFERKKPQTISIRARAKRGARVVFSPQVSLNVSPPLPPDPGAAGKRTIAGIDADGDGVRDDVQRYIALTYPESARARAALRQLAIAEQNILVSSGTIDSISRAQDNAHNCLDATFMAGGADVAGGKAALDASEALSGILLNTPARVKAYASSNNQFSGTVTIMKPYAQEALDCLIVPSSLPN